MFRKLFIFLTVLSLAACESQDDNTVQLTGVQLGEKVFSENCASCHGKMAQGLVADWKQPLPNGKYPAPPLNGTAHAWHHSPEVLLRTINNGGAKLGGWMPGFENKINKAEKIAVIDYIFNLWPKDIQDEYLSRFKK